MKKHMVPHCSGSQVNWDVVPQLCIEFKQMEFDFPVQAGAQLCWSDSAIHVRMEAREPQILARFTGDYDQVCRDSCLETFLSPIAEDGRYFNFEFNPNGACFFGFGSGRENLMRLHPWDLRKQLNIKTSRDGDSWTVRFDIPLDMIRLFMPEFTLHKGRRMLGNFYKCAEDARPTHELSWNPITAGNGDFHQPEFFGELILD